MATPCRHCGGELTMVNFEQAFGDPESRRWHFACRSCHTAHEFDSHWTLLTTQVPGEHLHQEAPEPSLR